MSPECCRPCAPYPTDRPVADRPRLQPSFPTRVGSAVKWHTLTAVELFNAIKNDESLKGAPPRDVSAAGRFPRWSSTPSSRWQEQPRSRTGQRAQPTDPVRDQGSLPGVV